MTSFHFFLPWMLRVIQEDRIADVQPSPPLKKISSDIGYQILVDEADGNLIFCNDSDSVWKLDVVTGARWSAHLQPIQNSVQSIAYDEKRGEILFSDPGGGYSFAVNPISMKVKSAVKIQNYDVQANEFKAIRDGFNRTLLDTDHNVMAVFNMAMGVVLLNGEGNRILIPEFGNGILRHGIVDFAIDPDHRCIHCITWNKTLHAASIDSPRIDRTVELPSLPDRITLDKKRSRLPITFPITGKVLVVSSADYQIIKTIDCFPGVRAIAVDPTANRFYLGGFAPFFEIRSLEDYSLLDRLVGPPYTRWIAVDSKRQHVYLTSFPSGTYQYEPGVKGTNPWAAFVRRHDPFFPIINYSIQTVLPLLKLMKPEGSPLD